MKGCESVNDSPLQECKSNHNYSRMNSPLQECKSNHNYSRMNSPLHECKSLQEHSLVILRYMKVRAFPCDSPLHECKSIPL